MKFGQSSESAVDLVKDYLANESTDLFESLLRIRHHVRLQRYNVE